MPADPCNLVNVAATLYTHVLTECILHIVGKKRGIAVHRTGMAGGQGKRVRTVVQMRRHDLRAVLRHAQEASSETEAPGSVRENDARRESDLRAKSEYPLRTRATGRRMLAYIYTEAMIER